MKVFMISYDLGVPEDSSDYEKVIDYIKSFGNWATPLKSQWFVVSNYKSASDICNDLVSITDANDKILVMEVGGDDWKAARISDDVRNWMNTNI